MHSGAFSGTSRFRLDRQLGRGGYGAVYLAQDLERGLPVALKLLTNMQPGSLYRFKQEFRRLSDLRHPNLVRLYELLSEADQWFFTMEYVDGVDFHQHVRRASMAADSGDTPTMRIEEGRSTTVADESGAASCDAHLLREALRQLTGGVQALHDAGNLHRDLKPSNVLVTREGRVVVLDFGLVIELDEAGLAESIRLTGTPLYMSPEQSAGLPLATSSDWYSVGLMIFAAMTGGLPFSGSVNDVFTQKRVWEPTRADLPDDAPDDLTSICLGLLRIDPQQRLTGAGLLARLDIGTSERTPAPARPAAFFVGRQSELAALHDALDDVERGRPATVLLRGSSGIGKTTTVRRFVDEVRRRRSAAVVLRVRCYERESVPYKGVDGLVDALVQHLTRLPPQDLQRVLPRELAHLERLFPSVGEIAEHALRQRSPSTADPAEVRRRGGRALRELVARLADLAPLVLFIDDVQWGDVDSARLLQELLRPPDPPAVLLIVSYRAEEADTSACVRELVAFGRSHAAEIGLRELRVGELSADESEELARRLLGEAKAAADAASAVARQGEGSPFFIRELARHRSDAVWSDRARIGSLDDLMAARLDELPPDCQALLEVLAVAGRPLDRRVLLEASKIESPAAALDTLVGQSLLRGRRSEAIDALELYHGRMTTGILAHVSAERLRQRHRHLAAALEGSGRADPETLFRHYHEAGERSRAVPFGLAAAEQAWTALAFNRAAELYAAVLADLPPADPSVHSIRTRLGDALANAGRGEEAAHAYLEAVHPALPASERLQLQQKAVGQFFRTGRFDEGLAAFRELLPALKLTWPATTRSALLRYLALRLRLRLRGLSARSPRRDARSDERLLRFDACFAVSTGLGVVDPLRARLFQTHCLRWALDAGEPLRIMRALALEAAFSAAPGGRTRARTETLFARVDELAARIGTPDARGLVLVARGIACYLRGDWHDAVETLARAEELLVAHSSEVVQELDNARIFTMTSLLYLGEVREVQARLPDLIADAHERRDLFAMTMLELRAANLDVMADAPARARARAGEAIARWSTAGFHVTHYSTLLRVVEIELYAGDGEAALAHLKRAEADLARSLLLRYQTARIEILFLRGRAALVAAAANRSALVADALRTADALDGERMAWSRGLAALIRGGAASISGQQEQARNELERAAVELARAGMNLHAAAARRQLGLLIGGADGRALVEAADAWMTAQQIVNPQKISRMIAPGR